MLATYIKILFLKLIIKEIHFDEIQTTFGMLKMKWIIIKLKSLKKYGIN